MVRSVLAHPHYKTHKREPRAEAVEAPSPAATDGADARAAAAASPALPTITQVRNNAGGAYQGGSDMKQEINEWLAGIAGEVHPRGEGAGSASASPVGDAVTEDDAATAAGTAGAPWALLLETQALTTHACMQRTTGLLPQQTVIPNPAKEECAKMAGAGCVVHHGLTHDLFDDLHAQGPVYDRLRARGWRGFDIVWLDYCGTLMTIAGRKKQMDIMHLFKERLLTDNGLLALTFAVRGSRNIYFDEVADCAVKLTMRLAAAGGYTHIRPYGQATYCTKRGIIHTVVFVNAPRFWVGRRWSEFPPSPSGGKVEYMKFCDRRRVLLKVWATLCGGDREAWAWMRDADWRRATPHGQCIHAAARIFSEFVAPSATVFVLDSALLPATKLLLHRRAAPFTVLEDELHGEVGIPHMDIINNFIQRHDGAYDSWWLNYVNRKAFNARALRKCNEWVDMQNIMTKRLLTSMIGIIVPFVTVTEPWRGGAVDWMISGVHTACRQFNHPTLHPIYVSTWVLGTPHMCIIFGVGDAYATDENGVLIDPVKRRLLERIAPKEEPDVKQYTQRFGWAFDRKKTPAPHAQRFKRMLPFITEAIPPQRVSAGCGDAEEVVHPAATLTMYEPGGFHVCPTYRAALYASHDPLEVRDMTRRGRRVVAQDAVATRDLMILTDEGTVPFREVWLDPVRGWLAADPPTTDGSPHRRLLLLLEITHKSLYDDMKATLRELSPAHTVVTMESRFSTECFARKWDLLLVVYAPIAGAGHVDPTAAPAAE